MTDWRQFMQAVDPTAYARRGDPTDPRIGDVVETDPDVIGELEPPDVVIVGFPEDEGVVRNGGRPGAAKGPARIRAMLSRLVAPQGFVRQGDELPQYRLIDLGDIVRDDDLETHQSRLGAVVAAVLRTGAFPIILGGGHETAYGQFLGYAEAGLRVGILNIDAHLDVRYLRDGRGHSGSPIRQAAEHRSELLVPGGYCCIGVQPQANPAYAFDFMRSRSYTWMELGEKPDLIVPRSLLRTRGAGDILLQTEDVEVRRKMECWADGILEARGAIMTTIDLDAVRQADSPGVSAPSPIGLSAAQLIAYVRSVMETGYVASLDVCECNPLFDRDDQTARLAALVAYEAILQQVGFGLLDE